MKMMKKTLLLIVGCLMCGKMHAQLFLWQKVCFSKSFEK